VWHIQEVEGDDLRVGGRRTGARWPWSSDSTSKFEVDACFKQVQTRDGIKFTFQYFNVALLQSRLRVAGLIFYLDSYNRFWTVEEMLSLLE
jgi:hypothetical protein